MAFVRFSRDKRGYEHLFLVQPASHRRGRPAARVLYWYRTPPNIRVGRPAFDEFARRELERRYPDVAFDWQALASTPIPPPAPDVERWRERRRQERAAKQAARAEAEAEALIATEADRMAEGEELEAAGDVDDLPAPRSVAEAAVEAAQADHASESGSGASEGESSSAAGSPAQPEPSGARRRRRRRRGGHRGPRPSGPAGK